MRLSEVQKSYDLFVSLGSACDPAAFLRNHGLRKYSMPLDWVVCAELSNVRRLFENRFAGYMDLDAMYVVDGSANHYNEEKAAAENPASSYFVRDTHYDILSVHDFPIVLGRPWYAAYPAFKEKSLLRIDRLLKGLAETPSVLFVRWAGQADEAIALRAMLSTLVAGTADLLVLQPDPGVTSVIDRAVDADGVCLVQVPDRPTDEAIWGEVLHGMSLRG